MKHIERFLATVARAPVDRPAAWLGLPENIKLPKAAYGRNQISHVACQRS